MTISDAALVEVNRLRRLCFGYKPLQALPRGHWEEVWRGPLQAAFGDEVQDEGAGGFGLSLPLASVLGRWRWSLTRGQLNRRHGLNAWQIHSSDLYLPNAPPLLEHFLTELRAFEAARFEHAFASAPERTAPQPPVVSDSALRGFNELRQLVLGLPPLTSLDAEHAVGMRLVSPLEKALARRGTVRENHVLVDSRHLPRWRRVRLKRAGYQGLSRFGTAWRFDTPDVFRTFLARFDADPAELAEQALEELNEVRETGLDLPPLSAFMKGNRFVTKETPIGEALGDAASLSPNGVRFADPLDTGKWHRLAALGYEVEGSIEYHPYRSAALIHYWGSSQGLPNSGGWFKSVSIRIPWAIGLWLDGFLRREFGDELVDRDEEFIREGRPGRGWATFVGDAKDAPPSWPEKRRVQTVEWHG